MLRLFGHVSARFSPRHPFLASVLILLICTPEVWCVMPPVVFNGTASVMDTGSAALNHPKGVVADTAGNVYIADTAHSQIVKINRTGDASALAITGLTT
ncbi:MAG TPA: hypothetical protein VJR03_13830, partial [Nitrospira sp.]|nr:hypothetical protein [Nitrospira sp.]